ncbi:MAG: heme exporter protein CcmD [Gammaproteobacteria bacterium]|nr:MAG: heme exporter protein CcmD [Gammaproteobacteria bacterium]
MIFRFDNLQDFLHMSGHGPYVWSAYAISIAVMLWLVISPMRRRRQLLADVLRQQRREVLRQSGGKSDDLVPEGRE